MPDNDTARKVCLDYTIAAAKAIGGTCRLPEGRRFRFIYLSGGAAERDQTKPLWFKQDYRRIRVRRWTVQMVPFPRSFYVP